MLPRIEKQLAMAEKLRQRWIDSDEVQLILSRDEAMEVITALVLHVYSESDMDAIRSLYVDLSEQLADAKVTIASYEDKQLPVTAD